MIDKVWQLTKTGKKIASSTLPSRRDEVLDYLYKNKSATTEELCMHSGAGSDSRSTIRRYESRGLIQEYGKGF